MPTVAALPGTPEARLFEYLSRQPGAVELANGEDRGVTFVSENGPPGAYFLRQDGSAYVHDAAGNEQPGYRALLIEWWRNREAEAARESQVAEAASAGAEAADEQAAGRAALIEALPDQCRVRPDRAYDDDVIDALIPLRRYHSQRFAALKEVLRRLGVSLRTLETLMNRRAAALAREQAGREAAAGYEDAGDGRMSQADRLIRLVPTEMLFVGIDDEADRSDNDSGKAFVVLSEEHPSEIRPLRSRRIRRWLLRKYQEATGSAPNGEAVKQALDTLEGRAFASSIPRHVIHRRAARVRDTIWIDICDERWQAYKVTGDGWEIVENPPVRFHRLPGMLPLPIVVRSEPAAEAARPGRLAALQALRDVLNFPPTPDGDRQFRLYVSFILDSLKGRGPYMVAVFNGEQGSAKSTATKIMRLMIDPHRVYHRRQPRDPETVRTAAANTFVLDFNNMSQLPGWLSDMLSVLSTGGADSARTFYTNGEEFVVPLLAPCILNGIPDLVSRADLADRALFFVLKRIEAGSGMRESELADRIDSARAVAFGAILDGLVEGLRNETRDAGGSAFRMADYADWLRACETAYWPSGTHAADYAVNRDETMGAMLDADVVAAVLLRWWSALPSRQWEESPAALLAVLSNAATPEERATRGWPHDSAALGRAVRRAMPVLRTYGIEVDPDRRSNGRRKISITEAEGPNGRVPPDGAEGLLRFPAVEDDPGCPPAWPPGDPGPTEDPHGPN